MLTRCDAMLVHPLAWRGYPGDIGFRPRQGGRGAPCAPQGAPGREDHRAGRQPRQEGCQTERGQSIKAKAIPVAIAITRVRHVQRHFLSFSFSFCVRVYHPS